MDRSTAEETEEMSREREREKGIRRKESLQPNPKLLLSPLDHEGE